MRRSRDSEIRIGNSLLKDFTRSILASGRLWPFSVRFLRRGDPRGHAANDVNASSGTKLAEGHGAPWEGRPPRPAVSIRHHKAGERDQDTPPISGSLVLSRSACSVVRSRLAVAEYFLFSLLPELPLLPRDRILAFSLAMFSDLGGFVQSNPVWLWMQESLSRSALQRRRHWPAPGTTPRRFLDFMPRLALQVFLHRAEQHRARVR